MRRFGIAGMGVVLIMIPVSAVFAMAAPVPEASLLTATAIADPQADTINAKRLELRDIISKSGAKDVGKTISAAKKLIELENPEDIVILINLMIQNPKTSLAEKTQKTILEHPNKAFLATALKQAGQDKSADMNIAAANLLIDMKEELEGLKVMVSLIKKGVITGQIIDIMDRVPSRDKLNGVTMADGKTIYNIEIQQALQEIYRTGTYPQEVRVFALLMRAAYYGCYLENDKALIWQTLERANHQYLSNAMILLEKTLNISNEGVMVAENILRKLTVSKIADIAQRAVKDIEKYENGLKERARLTLLGKRDNELADRDEKYSAIGYFSGPKATREDIRFLIGQYYTNPDPDVRSSVVLGFSEKTNYEDVVLPFLRKIAQNDPWLGMRANAIAGFIDRGLEKEALDLLKPLVEKMAQTSQLVPAWRAFAEFKDAKIKEEAMKYLTELQNDKKSTFNEKLYATVALLTNFEIKDQISSEIVEEGLKSSDPGVIEAVVEWLTWSAYINTNNNKLSDACEDIEKMKHLEKSEIPKIATLAHDELKRIYQSGFWQKLQTKDMQENK